MKKLSTALILSLYMALSAYCQKSEERKLSAFDKLSVSSEIKVFLKKGTEEKVKVIASGIELNEILTNVNGKTLNIEFDRGVHIDANAEVYLTYKEIREINVSASGNVSVQDTLTGDKVILNVSTSGSLNTYINLRTIDVKVGQGGSVRLKGRTGSIEVKANTKGVLAANDLKADSSYVRAGTASIVKINANSLLDADLSTGATLTYSGNPKSKSVKTGIGVTVNALE